MDSSTSTGSLPHSAGVRIVADVGGTNARFATVGSAPPELERVEVVACADYPGIEEAISGYLRRHGIDTVLGVCLAVPGPVEEDPIDLPNSPWSLDRAELEPRIGAPLLVLNDFTAQALSIDLLRNEELTWVGSPRPPDKAYRAVIGPGTGLGVAVQTPAGDIVPSEGGHVSFAPTNHHEIELLRELLERYGRVSAERVLSGPGLENLYWANERLLDPGSEPPDRPAPEIAQMAARGHPVARRTIADFLDILATFAGDVALLAWATGGVFLSGGVSGKLMEFSDVGRFRARFEDKGRFREFCERVPVAWITAEHPGLLGCVAAVRAAGWGSG